MISQRQSHASRIEFTSIYGMLKRIFLLAYDESFFAPERRSRFALHVCLMSVTVKLQADTEWLDTPQRTNDHRVPVPSRY